jgi:putative endonuclease
LFLEAGASPADVPRNVLAQLIHAVDHARDRARRRTLSPEHALGKRGEDLAHRYLEYCGLKVVARNWRPRPGAVELDLVAREGDLLVFVEVKSRSSAEYGTPERAIGVEKEAHIVRAALDYARRGGVEAAKLRFDVVSVVFSNPPAITHLRDVLHLKSN